MWIYVELCGFGFIQILGPWRLAGDPKNKKKTGRCQRSQRGTEVRRAVGEAAEGLVLSPGHQLCKLGIRELLTCRSWGYLLPWGPLRI
jgi:hypothetical protein